MIDWCDFLSYFGIECTQSQEYYQEMYQWQGSYIVHEVPEPGTVMMLGAALIIMVVVTKLRK